MAGYRPKSLEELNSLYDKSLNVKNEIDRKASDLEVKQEIYTHAAPVIPEEETVKEAAAEEVVTEEISGLVDDFIKNFGAPVPVKKVRPVAPATVKAVSSAKNDEVKAPVRQSSPVQASPNKPRLIRNSERNDLFENYKKVMDDEDDEDFSFHRRGRKRGKKLFEKKTASAEEGIQPSAEAETVESDTFENVVSDATEAVEALSFENDAAVADDIPETLDNIEAVIEKVLGRPAEKAEQEAEEELPEAVYEISQEESAEAQDAEYEDEAVYEQEESAIEAEPYFEEVQTAESEYVEAGEESFEEPAAEAETEVEAYSYEEADSTAEATEKKSYTGKNLLLCLLLLVLVLATAVSAVKAFAGINSDVPVLEKYHLYTADAKYIQAGIKKGDLIVAVHESVEEGDVFAYKKGDGRYGFAKLDGVLNEDTVIADNDGQKSIVFKNTVRGTFYKSIPVIGTFAAMIASYYLYIAGGLLLLAAILLLVIVFAFRDKKKKATVQTEEQKIAQFDQAQDTQYEDVEGDFRYLIQEETEDDYDVYRNEYEAEGEEGLPVYEPEDYKYEPDEYVNN